MRELENEECLEDWIEEEADKAGLGINGAGWSISAHRIRTDRSLGL